MPTRPKVVQVDIRRERLGSRSRLDPGDVKETLRALLSRVPERSDRAFLDHMLARHRELVGRVRAYADEVRGRRPIHPEHATAVVDELAAEDAVFTVDTGVCNVWAARLVRATAGRACSAPLCMGRWPTRCRRRSVPSWPTVAGRWSPCAATVASPC